MHPFTLFKKEIHTLTSSLWKNGKLIFSLRPSPSLSWTKCTSHETCFNFDIYVYKSQPQLDSILFTKILLMYENLDNNLNQFIIIWEPQRNSRAGSKGLDCLLLLSSNKYTADNERNIIIDNTHELWKKLSQLYLDHNKKLAQLSNSTIGILKT